MQRSRTVLVSFILLSLLGALPALAAKSKAAPAPLDKRPIVLRAMVDELERSMKMLKMDSFELPYFIAYELSDVFTVHLEGRFGALFKSDDNRSRRLRVEVRVGNYDFDNVGSKKTDYDFSYSPGFRASNQAPIDDDPLSLRNSLWLMTDQNYKAALKGYLKNRSQKVTEVDDNKAKSFSQEKAEVYTSPPRRFSFDRARWERIIRTASALFEKHPDIFDSSFALNAGKEIRTFVNTEGSRIITEDNIYSLSLSATSRAPDGMLLSAQKTLYALEEGKLPKEEEIYQLAREVAANLEALRKAPVIEPYTGPAILDGDATGVLFHEVLGHRLEGERQLDDEEGKTYKGQVGSQIIPDFLSVVDDPTLAKIEATDLNGYYLFDEEGVKAQRVVLIDHGILKSFLMSRTPIDGFISSNGHGRASSGEKPRARMGNTIVESSRKVPFAKLKQMLVEEVRKQGKPYGLIIKNIIGGSTHTSTWGYQAYKGMPEMVYRIFPDGREELVRGVEIVGTPIASINKIISTSDRLSIFNGYCGAESGYVPVSAVAPDVLMTEIETSQRQMKQSEKGPILPSPWTGPTK